MLQFFDELSEIVGDEDASTIIMNFNEEQIARAIDLVEDGFELTIEVDPNRLDHHILSLTRYEDDEIEEQVVI